MSAKHTPLSLGKDRSIIYSGIIPVLKVYSNSTIDIHNDKEALALRDNIVKCVNLHDELVHRVNFLQALLNDLLLPDDCRKYLCNDFAYINEKTDELLKRAKGEL